MREIERAKIAWAQAGITIEMVGPILHENTPADPAHAGKSILDDNWFDVDDFAGRDMKIAAEALGAAPTPDVLEVVFVGPMNVHGNPMIKNAWGATSFPLVHTNLPVNLQENTYSFIGSKWKVSSGGTFLDANLRTLGHEIGHALTNKKDSQQPAYIFYPFEFAAPDNSVNMRRRIQHSVEMISKTVRKIGVLSGDGNRLLGGP